MKPVARKKKEKLKLPTKYWLIILSTCCIILMVVSFIVEIPIGTVRGVIGRTIVPFQNGISTASIWIQDQATQFENIQDLINENESLKEQLDLLKNENILLQQEKFELNNLRTLYELDQEYSEYEKVGARIIAKDPGNWFHSFLIDKGSDDGILVDMNVIAGSGLVGRITEVGPTWSRVESIIDDNSNVSGTVLSTADNLIVSGDLLLMNDGNIRFSQLLDSNDVVSVGDKIVTSSISSKFLPGILIGYITSIDVDSNNLTKSGELTAAVDFEHLDEVLIILQTKQTILD